MKPPKQLALGFTDPKPRCPICGRRIEHRCKWCFKGGLGDPPMPEMKAWVTWTRGLERTLRKTLTNAGIAPVDIEQTCVALFQGRGAVPDAARPFAEPYLARAPSERSYNDDRAWALLGNNIREKLDYDHRDPYSTRFVDVLVSLSVMTIRLARRRGIPHVELDASDLVNAAHRALKEASFVDPDTLTPWHRVQRLAHIVVSNLLVARAAPKNRIAPALRIDTPRLRIKPQDDPATAEQEAVAEEEAMTGGAFGEHSARSWPIGHDDHHGD